MELAKLPTRIATSRESRHELAVDRGAERIYAQHRRVDHDNHALDS